MTEMGPLLDFAAEVGYQIQVSGGEIYRVEESVKRLLVAYGAPHGEVFAIPNCLTVSISDEGENVMTRIRRIPEHGTDIYRLEAVNSLCRRLCRIPEPVEKASKELREMIEKEPRYPLPIRMIAGGVGGGFFAVFFGASWTDGLCAAACGALILLVTALLQRARANSFFRTIVGSSLSALLALALVRCGVGKSLDLITIGALMNLVPGVALTTAIRDIMGGDMVSGLSKLGEAVFIAIAIAVGTGVAMLLAPWMGGGVL